MKNKDYLRVYSSVKLVRGKDRAAAYILDEEKIEIIPLSMIDVIDILYKHSITDAFELVDSKEVMQEYIDFILANRIGFLTSVPENIKSMDDYYEKPSHIFLSCIELDRYSKYDINSFVQELDEQLCKHIELRLLHEDLDHEELEQVLKIFEGTTIRSIDLYIKKVQIEKLDKLESVINRHKKVSKTILFSMPFQKTDDDIYFSKLDFENVKNIENKELFVNINFYTESLKYNTFYHKKVSIDKDGGLKNNLICSENFGQYDIEKNSLREIIKNDDFTKFWKINPDKIENIKDSELRYAIFPCFEIEEKEGKYYFKKSNFIK